MPAVVVTLQIDAKGGAKIIENSEALKKLGAQAGETEKGLKGIANQLGVSSQAFDAMKGAAGGVITALTMLAGAAAAVGAAVVMGATKAVEFAGKISDLSLKTGISSTALQKLGFAGSLVGTSMEDAATAVRKMQMLMVKAPEDFAKLGLSMAELKRLSPEQQFEKVGRAILNIGDEAQRTTAKVHFLGKGGDEALKLLSMNLDEVGAKAASLGAVMDDQTREALDKVGDSVTVLSTVWEHLLMNLGGSIAEMPEVINMIDTLAEAIGGLSKWIQDNKSLIQDLVRSNPLFVYFQQITNGARDLVSVLHGVSNKLDEIRNKGIGAVLNGNWDGTSGRIGSVSATASKVLTGSWNGGGKGGETAEQRANLVKSWNDSIEQARQAAMKLNDDIAKTTFQNLKVGADAAKKAFEDIQKQAHHGMKFLGEGAIEWRKRVNDVNKAFQEIGDTWDTLREADMDRFMGDMSAIADVGDALSDLGRELGSNFLSNVGQALSVFSQFGQAAATATTNFEKATVAISAAATAYKSGSVLTGIAAGAQAGSMFGPWGAAIGAGIGGILGFFGGKKKREEEKRKAAEQAAQEAKEAVEAYREGIKKAIASLAPAMGGITGSLKDGKVVGGINLVNEASAKAQATIFVGTFWATVKEQGLVAGVDALKAPFEALREKLTSGGFDVGALLGSVGGLFDMIGKDDGPVRAALEGVDALKVALQGMADAQMLTRDQFAAFGVAANDAYAQAVAGGLSSEQALSSMRPLLAAIIKAHDEYGFTIDTNTQALIDQSIAADGAFPKEPILEMRDAVRDLINEIRTLNGLPPRDWGPPPPSHVTGGGGWEGGHTKPPHRDWTDMTPEEHADGGTIWKKTLTWAGERGPEDIVPHGKRAEYAAKVMGGMGGPAPVINVYPSPGMDERLLAELVVKAYRNNTGRLRQELG